MAEEDSTETRATESNEVFSVWKIGPVRKILKRLEEDLDDSELRRMCYAAELITTRQKDFLAGITARVAHNEKLFELLRGGTYRSFQTFNKLVKHLELTRHRAYYKDLNKVAEAYVDCIEYGEDVRPLIEVKDHKQLKIEPTTLTTLEKRYNFVSPHLDADAEPESDKPTDDQEKTDKPDKVQPKPDDESFRYETLADREMRLLEERITRRIVLLCGNFNTMLKDLFSNRIANQGSIAEMVNCVKKGGIYCLTPSERKDPIYMILSLDPRDSTTIHAKLLRIALQMSRYVVIYHGEINLMSGFYFRNRQQNTTQPEIADATSLHGGAKAVKSNATRRRDGSKHGLFLGEVEILPLLHNVLLHYPLTSGIAVTYRSVRLHCILDCSNAASKGIQQYCKQYCVSLFGAESCSTDAERAALPTCDPSKGLPPPPVLQEFNLDTLDNFKLQHHVINSNSTRTQRQQLDPCVEPMWLHAMCGILPSNLYVSRKIGDRFCIGSLPPRAPTKVTESGKEDVTKRAATAEKQDISVLNEISLGHFEKVLKSWRGAVQVITLLACGDNAWAQQFLNDLAGMAFLGSSDLRDDQDAECRGNGQESAGANSVRVCWCFNQASSLLYVFLVFNGPMTTERVTANLVFATSAISNVCILPQLGPAETSMHVEAYVAALDTVANSAKRPLKASEEAHHEDEILSGTLLVSDKASNVEPHLDRLTQYYFSHVLCVNQQQLGVNARQLLSSQLQLKIYHSGSHCAQCLQLIVNSLNKDKLDSINLEAFNEQKYREVIDDLNRYARGIDAGTGNNDAKSSTRGTPQYSFAFTVTIENRYWVCASGRTKEELEVDDKTQQVDDNDLRTTDLTIKQVEDHRRLCQWMLSQANVKPKMLKSSVQQNHRDRLGAHIEQVKHYVTTNVSQNRKLQNVYGHILKKLCEDYINGMVRSQELCKGNCSFECEYPCMLPAGHGGDKRGPQPSADGQNENGKIHDCLVCVWDNGKHICEAQCSLCTIDTKYAAKKGKCSLKPGHNIFGDKRKPHLCMEPDELKRKKIHLCTRQCSTGGRDCKKVCCELLQAPNDSPHVHRCGVAPDKHLCNIRCALCTEMCKSVHNHQNTGNSRLHLCGNQHYCKHFCKHGVCQLDVENATTQSHEKITGNGWKRKCTIPIPLSKISHDRAHSCGQQKDQHFCGTTCRWCGRFCEKKQGDGRHLCNTKHGPVTQSTDRIIMATGQITVKVTTLAAQNKTTTEGAADEPATCSTLCSHAGERHIHLSGGNKRKHSVFWSKDMEFEDTSRGNKESFDLCPIQCDHDNVYCERQALHSESSDELRIGVTSNFIFATGHLFACGTKHPCKKPCSRGHSLAQYARWVGGKLKQLVGKEAKELYICAKFYGHNDGCECEDGDHVCGVTCSADKCSKACQVPESAGKHVRHDCQQQLSCLGTCKVQGCNRHCESPEHFHPKYAHYCGQHTCNHECACKGRCPAGGRQKCAFTVDSRGEHPGKTHRCNRQESEHACGDTCSADKCSRECQVPGSEAGKHQHNCRQQLPCQGTCKVQGCNRHCESPEHFHPKYAHYCGQHTCNHECACKGRCPAGGRQKCAFTVDSRGEHPGKTHRCNRQESEHACEYMCSADKCSRECQVPGSEAGKHQHNCRQQLPCQGTCKVQGCDRQCESLEHFHHKDAHYCGQHTCNQDCACNGRCPAGVRLKCVFTVNSEGKHPGKTHRCNRLENEHSCPHMCTDHGQQCKEHFGVHGQHKCVTSSCGLGSGGGLGDGKSSGNGHGGGTGLSGGSGGGATA